MSVEPTTTNMLDHVWRYFALHAGQRISLFNFFLIVAGSMSAGLAACIQRGGIFDIFGLSLGVLLIAVAFVFWKLDQRTGFLVKMAEDSISEIEQALPAKQARVFSREPVRTAASEGYSPTSMWTYGRTFRFMFSTMGLLGIGGATLCLGRYLGWWNLN